MARQLTTEWAAAVAGDRAAFEIFYQRHADRVFNHLCRRACSREDARDLTAEVFLLAWKRRRHVTFSDNDDIAPWLLTTANNLSRNHRRSEAHQRAVWYLTQPEQVEDDIAKLVNREATKSDVERVLNVLASLRPVDRDIIEVCVVEGVTPAEVAEATSTPAVRVRGRLHRALRRARQAYATAQSAERDGLSGGSA